MIAALTSSPDDTRALGAALAELARAGDVIVLGGDLGAGKTAFAQGFGRGLGIDETMTSPTFTIVRTYEGGRLRLHHADVYRLEHLQEAIDLGLAELVDDQAVTVIEWGDAIAPTLAGDYLEIRLAFGDADDDRVVSVDVVGRTWAARSAALRRSLEPWAKAAQ